MEKFLEGVVYALIITAIALLLFLLIAMARYTEPESACINGVVMYKTDQGWRSDSGRYMRFCAEGKQ